MSSVQLSRASVVAVLLKHVGELPDIIDAARSIVTAVGLRMKWEASKTLGDLLVPIAAEFLGEGSAEMFGASGDEAEMCAAAGFDWSKLEKLLPIILQVLGLLLADDKE
jgi:hypothetical protein